MRIPHNFPAPAKGESERESHEHAEAPHPGERPPPRRRFRSLFFTGAGGRRALRSADDNPTSGRHHLPTKSRLNPLPYFAWEIFPEGTVSDRGRFTIPSFATGSSRASQQHRVSFWAPLTFVHYEALLLQALWHTLGAAPFNFFLLSFFFFSPLGHAWNFYFADRWSVARRAGPVPLHLHHTTPFSKRHHGLGELLQTQQRRCSGSSHADQCSPFLSFGLAYHSRKNLATMRVGLSDALGRSASRSFLLLNNFTARWR